jgi:hypothetical protein
MATPSANSPDRSAALALARHDARVGAVVNALLNAGLSAWLLRGKGPHPLSVDSIASREPTVLGSAVTLALSLGLIAGSLSFVAFRRKAGARQLLPNAQLERTFLRVGLPRAAWSALVMTALVTLAAVLWQRFAGTVHVGTPVAALLSGVVAGLTAWYVGMGAARALLDP